jgi:peroxiredoxin
MKQLNRNQALNITGVGLMLALCTTTAALAADRETSVSVGSKAPSFEAKTTEGKTVKFPADYKGKVVLLDFWATWCPPCRAEAPNLAKAYEKYHAKGFDVLGISLDRANSESKLADFTKANRMPWPQVYDGKYWSAEVAEKYGVHSIPQPILVDGDTGVVLGLGEDARGSQLGPTIEKALAKKKSQS